MKILAKILSVEGCQDCLLAENMLKNALNESGHPFKIKKIDFSLDEAIDLAIQHDFDEIPSLLIGEIPLKGPKFNMTDIKSAIERTSK